MADYRELSTDPTIKAGNTAAVAADASMVVALSPNSPLPAGANTIGTVNIGAPSMTYAAAVSGLAPAALATDVFAISGSATKTIRISKLAINGVQTTAGQVAILVVKRSTANTGGTSTAQTKIPYDSANAAATATVLAYTANPTTLGTVVGTITASRLFVPGVASATDAQGFSIVVGDVGQQFITLRGAAENLCINLNGVTVAGGAVNVTIEWTES